MFAITVIGAGYVGLVTALCFADAGHDVITVDIDAQRIAMLNAGKLPIYEPGLEELLTRNLAAGTITFTTDLTKAITHGAIQFIAVGTPAAKDGTADLQYVLQVADTIGQQLSQQAIIVTKSTVPVGTADKVRAAINKQLQARKVDLTFDVVANPEFLKEGSAVADFIHPDRVVVGADNAASLAVMQQLYAPFTDPQHPLISMDVRSAELTKYAANAMLATKISFINEICQIAERVGANIDNVRAGISWDQRIGPHFINPGCGYGGSCFPKDVRALIATAIAHDYQPELLMMVDSVNEKQKTLLFHKIVQHFSGELQGKTLAVWGLAFKPNTDDMREASSCVLLQALWQAGVKVQAYDPVATAVAAKLFGKRDDLQLCQQALAAIDGADALVIVTEWDEFKHIDLQQVKAQLRQPVIFDGRNIYEPDRMQKLGFNYNSLGRANELSKEQI